MLRRFVHTSARKAVDVCVIGGGPAGLAVLAALQGDSRLKGLRACAVDAQPLAERLSGWKDQKTKTPEFENRVISITPGTVGFLEKVGAWQHVAADRVAPYDEMRVWDGESGSEVVFDGYDSFDDGVIATMIEISNLQQALYKVASADVVQAKVAGFERTPEGLPLVKLENGEEISARLLVGADGQRSAVRPFAGIEYRGWDYGKSGVVGTLKLEFDTVRKSAYQRFLRTGPLAILPLPGDRATMVWSTTPERAQWLRSLRPETLAAVVNAALRFEMVDIDYLHSLNPANDQEILNEIEWRMSTNESANESISEDNLPAPIVSVAEGTVAAFPLKMRHADSYLGDRIALVGDAGHATHPLTGQGFNMGLRDVRALTSALALAVDRGLDIGTPLALEPYPRTAYLQNHLLLGVNDKLHKLYSTDCWPVVAARSFGLSAFNSVPWLKQAAMQQASL